MQYTSVAPSSGNSRRPRLAKRTPPWLRTPQTKMKSAVFRDSVRTWVAPTKTAWRVWDAAVAYHAEAHLRVQQTLSDGHRSGKGRHRTQCVQAKDPAGAAHGLKQAAIVFLVAAVAVIHALG